MATTDAHVEAFLLLHGESDPEALILRLCRELLAKAPTEQGKTPLLILGSCRGMRPPKYVPLDNPSMLVPADGGFNIFLKESDPPERQQFSHAHEIVHTFFQDVPGYTIEMNSEGVEELCDLGAAELTMPAARFLPVLLTVGVSLVGLKACMEQFGTSLQACARRAAHLVNESLLVVVADATGSAVPNLTDLEVTRRYRSTAWPVEDEPSDRDVLGAIAIREAFENTDERAGTIQSADQHGHDHDYRVEAIGYDFQVDHVPHRRVIALIVPSC